MTDLSSTEVLAQRYYRCAWRVGQGAMMPGTQPLQYRRGLSTQQDLFYPEFRATSVGVSDHEKSYNWRSSECIYCGKKEDISDPSTKLTDEHLIPRGIGGTLILKGASCDICKNSINAYENKVINMLFQCLIKHAGVRTRGKGFKTKVKCCLVDENNVERQIFLPMDEHPVVLTMGQFMAPGILAGRQPEESGLGSLWTKAFRFDPTALNEAVRRRGVSETFDVLVFSQFLAKIAHGFMIAELRPHNVRSLLTDFIQTRFDRNYFTTENYMHIGGSPHIDPSTEHLHEIGLTAVGQGSLIYVVVRLRLFANLGIPTYYIVPGYFTNLSMFATA